ncbi:hypothetical protein GCM10023084_00530 [Streptomyces lacrimifluminis]|uniref:Uncharacterized protein n=1 Tax=Streptomyces lacrimifluminis TaxID=1500077 RepID=A0A917KM14_9ACTN|nr:hypothetical protein [Streptomyces lacrimifluminis]GGJ20144.1 hypothetical protein GCM10012282_15610 [Streptomyces lacrimifluminis]
MFEIRVICESADTDRVVAALDKTFATGTVTVYPTDNGKSHRFYVRADHLTDLTREETDRPEAGPTAWPTPEDAYATAPAIPYEIAWTASTTRTLAKNPPGGDVDREYWLRKAALLDRIALDYEAEGIPNGTDDIAANAARQLIEIDHGSDPNGPQHPATLAHPRGYVRHEYAHWANNQ